MCQPLPQIGEAVQTELGWVLSGPRKGDSSTSGEFN